MSLLGIRLCENPGLRHDASCLALLLLDTAIWSLVLFVALAV